MPFIAFLTPWFRYLSEEYIWRCCVSSEDLPSDCCPMERGKLIVALSLCPTGSCLSQLLLHLRAPAMSKGPRLCTCCPVSSIFPHSHPSSGHFCALIMSHLGTCFPRKHPCVSQHPGLCEAPSCALSIPLHVAAPHQSSHCSVPLSSFSPPLFASKLFEGSDGVLFTAAPPAAAAPAAAPRLLRKTRDKHL